MRQYAILREQAAYADLSPLLLPRGPPDGSPIDEERAHLLACAFLRFNCDYGDMIRWLEGPYTDDHRDWDAAFEQFETVRNAQPAPKFPTPDFDRTRKACTNGVPLQANFSPNLVSCRNRAMEAPSAILLAHEDDVDETLRKEEKLSYHIVLPRFLWQFFPGIYIAIFRMAYKYGDPKPRLCVDPSTLIAKGDTGNVNREIPDPGIDEDQNPKIHYGTAFDRYLIWIWNLRITYPTEDILQTTDDVSAAFHRMIYHPDMGPAFATVWKQFLIIPVSCIFGSRSSPGDYMRKGELRAHYANFMDIPPSAFEEDLIKRIKLPPLPTPEEVAGFAQALADDENPGINIRPNGDPERRGPVYVDDTGNAHIRAFFLAMIAASIHAAYVMFGHPLDDPDRPPCINPSKWCDEVFHHLHFLGYFIDTRRMLVCWPLAKREKLRHYLDVVLSDPKQGLGSTPHSISKLLGLLRHSAPVAPMGTHRSLRLQFLFNDVLKGAPETARLRRWYQRRCVVLPPHLVDELTEFRTHISDDLYDPFWCRPIGLMVPRTPTITVCTDASSKALGGWSRFGELNHMWRITVEDLFPTGPNQKMNWDNPHNFHEPKLDKHKAHINILEFFAIFIELWICLRQLMEAAADPSLPMAEAPAQCIPPGGHRLLVRADNTSALSWLRYATRTKRQPVRRIARLLTGLLSSAFASTHLRVQGKHLAGIANVSADNLSRFELSASWGQLMVNCHNLTPLRICLFPQELLSLLTAVFIKEQTEDWYATATTKLLTIAPPRFVTGSNRKDTITCVVPATSPDSKPSG